jgi:hypothetical protein
MGTLDGKKGTIVRQLYYGLTTAELLGQGRHVADETGVLEVGTKTTEVRFGSVWEEERQVLGGNEMTRVS